MIYTIPMVIILIFLAVFFRDEIRDDFSEYLAMVCLGAIFWPVTFIWMIWVYFDWRRG